MDESEVGSGGNTESFVLVVSSQLSSVRVNHLLCPTKPGSLCFALTHLLFGESQPSLGLGPQWRTSPDCCTARWGGACTNVYLLSLVSPL
jgi:hypothetical protein